MAIDAYLQIEGIKGESQDDKHRDWIEVTGVHWSVSQPRSSTASTSGGHTAGRADITDILFSKLADLSSPLLFQTSAMGKTIPKAKFEVFRADGNGTRVKYFEIQLENVVISQVTPSITGGGIMTESVSLKFSKIKLQYTQQKVGGGIAGNTSGGWDLAKNMVVA